MTPTLEEFVVANLTKKDTLGVIDPVLGQAIKEAVGCKVSHIGIIPEVNKMLHLINSYLMFTVI